MLCTFTFNKFVLFVKLSDNFDNFAAKLKLFAKLYNEIKII